ncbi:hypothetical protein CDD83_3451 [Cordyceps sp. RAO-2017]|nr:hypothetical protein CDD83_3451 [Cordyceps sp. RAO-2017]
MPSKVELVLAKKNARKWPQLLRDDASSSSAPVPGEGNSSTDGTAEAKRPDAATPAQDGGAGPSYPTSSRRGPKDWDRIGAAAEDEDEDEAGDRGRPASRHGERALAQQKQQQRGAPGRGGEQRRTSCRPCRHAAAFSTLHSLLWLEGESRAW